MANGFNGRTALITGAASGIGAGIAKRLTTAGVKVALLDLNMDGLNATRDEIMADGGIASVYQADVTSETAVEQAVLAAEQELGLVTLAVAGAGIIFNGLFLDLPYENWQKTMAVNLGGCFLVFKHVARRLVAADECGSMVALSSGAGRGGRPYCADYAASKAGIINLVKSAAKALAPNGITVNAVCPGIVDAPMTMQNHNERAAQNGITPEESLAQIIERIPLGRIQTVNDVTNVVMFLLSEQGDYLTGQALNATGGMEMG